MEKNMLTETQQDDLINQLEQNTKLPLPRTDPGLGNLTILVNHRKNNNFMFQIRWGVKNIFLLKSVSISDADKIQDKFAQLIKSKKDEIRKNLIEYCVHQLNDNIIIELPIELKKYLPAFIEYKAFVALCRQQRKDSDHPLLWPPISLFIAWDDYAGEFQEFVYPLKFDYDKYSFEINFERIIKSFIRYRDSV